MSEELSKYQATAAVIEAVIAKGDLASLPPAERVNYYKAVCESLGLNPLTKPFEYIILNGKLTLYARRDAADQLRKRDHVSVTIVSRERMDDLYIVAARATTPDNRTDESIGAVNLAGLKGDALANAIMKAETKAKRRVTLSIVGLGWLDETEIESIPDARPATIDTETGEMPKAGNGKAHGKEPDLDALKRAFFNRVLMEIPYYNHGNHIVNTLKGMGFGKYDPERETEMWDALQKHANEKANEKAAQNKPPTLDEELEAAQAAAQKESPL